MTKIAVISGVRQDNFFTDLWVRYYGALFGREHLHLMIDGDDWEITADVEGVTLIVEPGVPRRKHPRNVWASAWHSRYAAALLAEGYGAVLRVDIDEYLALDPEVSVDLPTYLAEAARGGCISALGIDVVHNRAVEGPVGDGPILHARRYGVVTREFSKAVLIGKPVEWDSGFHRAHGQQIVIDPALYLFHLALFDYDRARERAADRARVALHDTLEEHLKGRLARFEAVKDVLPLDGEDALPRARHFFQASKKGRIRTRPGKLPDGNVSWGYYIKIPARLRDAAPLLRLG